MTPAYAVQWKPSADRRLRKLPTDVQRRIVGEMEALGFDPRPAGVVKLSDTENVWRIRVGDYRIVHEGEALDFHPLRHPCGAWLARSGAHPKAAQAVLRHSTITLTMDTFSPGRKPRR